MLTREVSKLKRYMFKFLREKVAVNKFGNRPKQTRHSAHTRDTTHTQSQSQTRSMSSKAAMGSREPRKSMLTVESCQGLPRARLPEYVKSQHNRLYNIIWRNYPPKNVLMIKKPWDLTVREAMIQLINHLHVQYPSVNIVVNEDVADELVNEVTTVNKLLDESVSHVIYTGKNKDIIDKIDLMITLGGDGTILKGVSLFSNVKVPPVLSFAMGTLGFLLPFDYSNSMECFRSVYEGRAKALHRNRLECHVLRTDDVEKEEESASAVVDGAHRGDVSQLKIEREQFSDKREMIHAMNDITIHRGSLPNLTSLDIYIDGEFFTTTYADGLIFSTPTGSTAYSLSAGGSITHPVVPCILLTPICPRSLSFRPLILPSTSDIMIKLSENNRNNFIELTIDGISQADLHPGDELHITSETVVANTLIRQQSLLKQQSQSSQAQSQQQQQQQQQQQSIRSMQEEEEMLNGDNIVYNDKNGIWCVATNPNQWSKDLNSLLGFNSSFRDQKGKKLHL
ncbi:uncharacterized protein LODBEIA_P31790 [Lodderomyces beijingensis]|uniref:Uncharacterized protein n=1 Tax=Lodderomyces beijingensis TaxID=1775926 RepID=A0ABP0ZRX9_9ASCO